MSDTGYSERVVAFDCDGTLNDMAVGQIGVDNGARWDITVLLTAMRLGCRVAVMTCNDPAYVAAKLQELGVKAYADVAREHKVPPWLGVVLVTDRKVLADEYLDDRNVAYKFGDDPTPHFRRWAGLTAGNGAYDYLTVEYRAYVETHLAFVEGNADAAAEQAAMAAAQTAAAQWHR